MGGLEYPTRAGYIDLGNTKKTFPAPNRSAGNVRGTDWNRQASASLSPTLTLFIAPHGKLYLRLQKHVPESEGVRLTASTPPKTRASSIAIPGAIPQATDFSNRYPKVASAGVVSAHVL